MKHTEDEVTLIGHYRVSNRIIPIEIPEDAVIFKIDSASKSDNKFTGMLNSLNVDVCDIDFDGHE